MNLKYKAIILLLAGLAASFVLINSIHKKEYDDSLGVRVPYVDQTSYSNLLEIKTTHFHLDIQLDFSLNQINGTQTLFMTATRSGASHLDLDIDGIQVQQVREESQGELKFVVNYPKEVVTGEQLSISLKEPLIKGKQYIFYIDYSVQNSSASSWLTPQQTASKILPYLFTQCESTYCRSLAPFQDSPYIKSTYSANVTVQDPINIFLSANLTSKIPHPTLKDYSIYSFRMDIPIPSYLFTIVAGNVVLQMIGERTGVISEPTHIQAYANELSDLELYLQTLENYTIPYTWGNYQIVILPPSFPFGGMENPLVTFASPSIIVGDKSGVQVAIHEIAHSWFGNLVTLLNWRNVWINEGLTVYLERQANLILGGEDNYLIDSYVGNNTLMDDMNGYGLNSNYTSLHPFVKGTNPDDSFSNVPYEKGFQFVAYLETVVGKEFLQGFLRSYLQKFKYQSIDHVTFREFFTEYLILNNPRKASKILTQINWDAWINGVGLPPVILNFTTPIVPETQQLAKDYISLNGTASPSNYDFFNQITLNAKTIFLQYLFDNLSSVNTAIIQRIDQDYQLSNSTNMELQWRWYRVTIKVGYNANIEQIHSFLGSIGRLKMISPVYQALVETNQKALAQQYFNEYQNFYHPIAVIAIKKIVQ
ncbi:peptidase M1 family aminopeptidase (macronuclear) [Tetrahymena thermophila SB210]|uniref:Peptidase M1 family aminopeptidase n=1 Tax=Tetrahymena thermophila (strain SB210) TaxID=312017 RepID=Q22HJ5_TETTS|nr:peptidase M1 family aminopeptidase [Tetrahymena thermophila SB210]EAR84706.2 peptidase M1 family aminopeptidase [Tetrahymena thermophila SB210]|eukprot:XP_001032369.2 peptidase M1 family aminopeptidase [Tetrahymena thermophila SB210]